LPAQFCHDFAKSLIQNNEAPFEVIVVQSASASGLEIHRNFWGQNMRSDNGCSQVS